MRNISEFNSGLKSLNTTVQQSLVHCKFRREFPGRKIHIAAPSCDTDVQRRWQCGKQDPQWCTFVGQNASTCSDTRTRLEWPERQHVFRHQDSSGTARTPVRVQDTRARLEWPERQHVFRTLGLIWNGQNASACSDTRTRLERPECQHVFRTLGHQDSAGTVTTKVHQTAVTGSGDFQFCDESHSQQILLSLEYTSF